MRKLCIIMGWLVMFLLACDCPVYANGSQIVYVCDGQYGDDKVSFYVCRDKIKSYFGKVPKGNTEWECMVRLEFLNGPMRESGAYYGSVCFEYRLSNNPKVSFIETIVSHMVYGLMKT